MKEFEQLIKIAKRKTQFDKGNSLSNGAKTYLAGIKEEVDEVIEELPKSRQCYLEDELGDILWDYLNVLTALEKEQDIDIQAVLKRACQKYEERVAGIESGKTWPDIKEKQKIALAKEHSSNI